MNGIEAINHYNGWAMAVTGAIIVMCGLTILSFIISLLPKIISGFEKKETSGENQKPDPDKTELNNDKPVDYPSDPVSLKEKYISLSNSLGESFELSALYTLCNEKKEPHPHISIRTLRSAGLLVPQEDGKFTWR